MADQPTDVPTEEVVYHLKPCPFCGSDAVGLKEYHDQDDQVYHYGECDTCGARGPQVGGFYEGNAVMLWNRRADD